MFDEWKRKAKESNLSTSTYVKEIVEKHLASQGTITSRGIIEDRVKEAVQQIGELRFENNELNKKLERMNTLLDRYEEQIRNMQTRIFTRYRII
jgi:hypothetical protein